MTMTNAEIAILISGISTCIALFALGWNVYRDVILKPKVRVRLRISEILTPEDISEERDTRVDISATNYGPGTVILETLQGKRKRLFRKTKSYLLFHDYTDPMTNQFPCELGVGKRGTFLFPFHKGSFLSKDFNRLGIADSFSRIHWVPKKDIKRTKATYKEYFGKDRK